MKEDDINCSLSILFNESELLPLIQPKKHELPTPLLPFPLRTKLYERFKQSFLKHKPHSLDDKPYEFAGPFLIGFLTIGTALLTVRIGYKTYKRRLKELSLSSSTKTQTQIYNPITSNSLFNKHLVQPSKDISSSPSNNFNLTKNIQQASKPTSFSLSQIDPDVPSTSHSFSTLNKTHPTPFCPQSTSTHSSIVNSSLETFIKDSSRNNRLQSNKSKITSDFCYTSSKGIQLFNNFYSNNSSLAHPHTSATSSFVNLSKTSSNQYSKTKTSPNLRDPSENLDLSIERNELSSPVTELKIENSSSQNYPQEKIYQLHSEDENEDTLEEKRNNNLSKALTLTSLYSPWEIFSLFFLPLIFNLTLISVIWLYFTWHFNIKDLPHFIKMIKWLFGRGPHHNKE